MNFTLKRSGNFPFNYKLDFYELKQVSVMKDLAVHFTANLNFMLHIIFDNNEFLK